MSNRDLMWLGAILMVIALVSRLGSYRAPTLVPPPPTAVQTTLPDGLKYTDLVVGTGPVPKVGDTVQVYYMGTLTDGKKFDSTADHQPFEFKVGMGMVIKGWDEGVVSMHVGGKRRLEIPPTLAYGAKEVGGGLIPANSTLLFDVELLAIKPAQ